MRSLRSLNQKRGENQGARISPLSFKFERERERRVTWEWEKVCPLTLVLLKKKKKHFYMQILSCSLMISSPKYDQEHWKAFRFKRLTSWINFHTISSMSHHLNLLLTYSRHLLLELIIRTGGIFGCHSLLPHRHPHNPPSLLPSP